MIQFKCISSKLVFFRKLFWVKLFIFNYLFCLYICSTSDHRTITVTLEIQNIQNDDFGNYNCQVYNGHTKVKFATVELKRKGNYSKIVDVNLFLLYLLLLFEF